MSIEHAMNKKLQIHNSTAEFFIFQIENKEEGIEVLYQDESLWLTQDAIAVLFDKKPFHYHGTSTKYISKPRITRRLSLSEIPTNCFRWQKLRN